MRKKQKHFPFSKALQINTCLAAIRWKTSTAACSALESVINALPNDTLPQINLISYENHIWGIIEADLPMLFDTWTTSETSSRARWQGSTWASQALRKVRLVCGHAGWLAKHENLFKFCIDNSTLTFVVKRLHKKCLWSTFGVSQSEMLAYYD